MITKCRSPARRAAQGGTGGLSIPMTVDTFDDECLNGEIFYSLKEATVVIEQWRKHYNTIRPHSSLNYRPPAPQTFTPKYCIWIGAQRCSSLYPVGQNYPSGHANTCIVEITTFAHLKIFKPALVRPTGDLMVRRRLFALRSHPRTGEGFAYRPDHPQHRAR